MRVLVADDNADFREYLAICLKAWDYDCVEAADGARAWEILQAEREPILALLDWVMPGLSGLDVCRHVRGGATVKRHYLILLTGRSNTEDVVTGLEGGADEYLTKPVDPNELRARLNAGKRILELQGELARRLHDLSAALTRVKQLQGMLPICAWCKKIRDDHNYWLQVEEYISTHAEVSFTHSICPECFTRVGRTSTPSRIG